MSKYKCLLMDMDGLLVDSERITFEMWREIFQRHGYELDLEHYCQFLGKTEPTIVKLLDEMYPGLSLYDHIWPEWDGNYDELAPKGLIPLKKGALELLDYCEQNGLPMAIVSSNLHHWVDVILHGDNVYDRFDLVLWGACAPKGKPAPDLFLMAAEKLGFSPEECLVLEDSDAGITAGHNAGMDVCCIPDLRYPGEECQGFCSYILPDLEKVIPLL